VDPGQLAIPNQPVYIDDQDDQTAIAVRLVADRFERKQGREVRLSAVGGYAQIKAAVEKSRVKAGPTSYSAE